MKQDELRGYVWSKAQELFRKFGAQSIDEFECRLPRKLTQEEIEVFKFAFECGAGLTYTLWVTSSPGAINATSN
jgi:hypothetical protein